MIFCSEDPERLKETTDAWTTAEAAIATCLANSTSTNLNELQEPLPADVKYMCRLYKMPWAAELKGHTHTSTDHPNPLPSIKYPKQSPLDFSLTR